ncbi:hypothetical protein [Oribacterium sp. P6A1]|uniref:hypothetical protein n=1 Tax=Oribacterium sp. P6A1 TaxID=1410612 RepID=UPI0005649691|nr:hypothetical protein [Oribacterium sp. P6A1]
MPKNISLNDNLKRGIALVFIANAINLCISLINGFVLPKYLSVESFADIKTYHLYANYIGVLALGYPDGLYLQYGGKKISDVGSNGFNECRSNLIVLQTIITVIGVVFGWVTGNSILLVTAISIIPVNLVSSYKNIYQATGEFKSYSRILNYTSILVFVGTMILLFIKRTDNSLLYIGWNVVVTFFIWILVERKMTVSYKQRIGWSLNIPSLIENIKSGIVLMLGNFSSILMTSVDRWFVKALLTVQHFAYYSFVISVENLVAIFITPVVTTMYNYICVTTDMKAIKRIKRMCLVFSLFLISSAFPAKFILEVYLQKYLASKYVLFILFSTEVFYMIIKGIYVNIYKARKHQSTYLKQLIGVIIIGVILNAIFYYFARSNEGIAFATLLSVVIWYVICCISVPEIMPDWKEILFVIIAIPLFILSGFYLEAIVGFVVYMAGVLVLSMIFMKESLTAVWNMVFGMVRKRLGR